MHAKGGRQQGSEGAKRRKSDEDKAIKRILKKGRTVDSQDAKQDPETDDELIELCWQDLLTRSGSHETKAEVNTRKRVPEANCEETAKIPRRSEECPMNSRRRFKEAICKSIQSQSDESKRRRIYDAPYDPDPQLPGNNAWPKPSKVGCGRRPVASQWEFQKRIA